MKYTELDARFVAPPPFIQMILKRSLREYLFLSLKCYSDWCFATIQNALKVF